MARVVYYISQAAVIISSLYFVWSCEMKQMELRHDEEKLKLQRRIDSIDKQGE